MREFASVIIDWPTCRSVYNHRYLTSLHGVIGTLRKTGFEQIEIYTMKGRYNFLPSSRRKKWEMFKVITKFWQTSERNVRQFVSRRFPHYFWIFTAFSPFPSSPTYNLRLLQPWRKLIAFGPFPSSSTYSIQPLPFILYLLPSAPFPHPLYTAFGPFPTSPIHSL